MTMRPLAPTTATSKELLGSRTCCLKWQIRSRLLRRLSRNCLRRPRRIRRQKFRRNARVSSHTFARLFRQPVLDPGVPTERLVTTMANIRKSPAAITQRPTTGTVRGIPRRPTSVTIVIRGDTGQTTAIFSGARTKRRLEPSSRVHLTQTSSSCWPSSPKVLIATTPFLQHCVNIVSICLFYVVS